MKPLNCSGNMVVVALLNRHVPKSAALLSLQQPIDNFPHDQRLKNWCFVRFIQEPNKAHHGIEQTGIQWMNVNSPQRRSISRRGITNLNQNAAHKRSAQFQTETEVGSLFGGL